MTEHLVDDGVVKYIAIHMDGDPPAHPLLTQLNQIRTQRFDLQLVGAYPNGIGYGNVSIRLGQGCVISGTATGALRELSPAGYCQVQKFDIEKNTVHTIGPVPASSESMTHCAMYQADNSILCVLHVHHKELWDTLLTLGYASAPASVPYGTPMMAQTMASLVKSQNSPSGLLVMAGHEEGIVSYGLTVELAFEQIQSVYSQYIQ